MVIATDPPEVYRGDHFSISDDACADLALWDTETNGLLEQASTMHCAAVWADGIWYSGNDRPGWTDQGTRDVELPSGKTLKGVRHVTNAQALKVVARARIRVAHNGDNYDDRVTPKLYAEWVPEGDSIDTLILSRLLFPMISKQGPNSHKCPGQLVTRHSLEAWGYRLGEKKDKGFDAGDWQTWTPPMQPYMLQDVESLKPVFGYLKGRLPKRKDGATDWRAYKTEAAFAKIISRQVAWGFTVDYPQMLALAAEIETTKARLEGELVETFGEWWEPGKETRVKATRRVKVLGHPDVTMPRYNKDGKRLSKDYVGPPLCVYEEGAKYTPIERVEFSPGSREHVAKMLTKKYGWKPKKWTDGGKPQIDDDVLRALDYPEAPKLADYYAAVKVSGFVSTGNNAWLKLAQEEGHHRDYRMHGQVITIGTYTFRCSHFKPNMGQIPSRDPHYGHRCRSLFIARWGFHLVGFDGSGMQLRLLAHYLAKYDGGAFAKAVSEGDPHAYMRDTVGTDLLGEGDEGRKKGKTLNYALLFGGGEERLGSIASPHASSAEKIRLGKLIKARLAERFSALDQLKDDIKSRVLERRSVVGLDGRVAEAHQAHTALSTLLQMGEKIVMANALIILDEGMQAKGYRPGVDRCGRVLPREDVDYEFVANVHDEAQADVKEHALDDYTDLALECVAEAGRRLGVKCPLKSDVKVGNSWQDTH